MDAATVICGGCRKKFTADPYTQQNVRILNNVAVAVCPHCGDFGTTHPKVIDSRNPPK